MKIIMRIKYIIIISAVLSLSHSFLKADEISSARFLLVNPGGRPNAMGEAFTGIADDNNAIFWNPAGIAYLSQREVSFTHIKGLISINLDYLTYIHPVECLQGAVGGNISYLSDSQWKTDEQGTFIGEFNNDALTAVLTYGRAITTSLSTGVSIKILRWTLDNHTANGVAADIGFLYRDIFEDFNIGLAVLNAGPNMEFVRDDFSLPMMTNVGFGFKTLSDKLKLGLDVNYFAIDKETGLNIGGEYLISELFSFRMGYKYHPDDVEDKRIGGLSTGLGFGVDGYNLDYAFVPYGELGDMHKMSFTVKF